MNKLNTTTPILATGIPFPINQHKDCQQDEMRVTSNSMKFKNFYATLTLQILCYH